MNITYERLPVNDLKTERYNREVDRNEVKKIAAMFDPSLVGLIVVSFRDGNYTVIDGQHRVTALRVLRIKDVMCQVFNGLTYEEEAKLFVELNTSKNRKALNAYDFMKGLYESRDPVVREMFDIVHHFGFEISASVGDNKLACAHAIYQIIKRNGAETLADVFAITKEAWGGDRDALRGQILQGIAHLLINYAGKIEKARLPQKLKTVTPMKILAEAKSDTLGGQTKTKVARQMLKYYNLNLHASKKVQERR